VALSQIHERRSAPKNHIDPVTADVGVIVNGGNRVSMESAGQKMLVAKAGGAFAAIARTPMRTLIF
jgi:hypothetical protein